jgi:hypothetical protein
MQIHITRQNGSTYTTSDLPVTYEELQAAISGTGFVDINGTQYAVTNIDGFGPSATAYLKET